MAHTKEYYLAYYHTKRKKKTNRRYVRFTPEEIEYIGAHSATERPAELARYFGVAASSISRQIEKNGFEKFRRSNTIMS